MINRREVIALLGAAGTGALVPKGRALPELQTGEAHHQGPEPAAVTPQEALERLKAGNARFANGKSMHGHESVALRKQLTTGQHPFATVVGCSDSRVPVELIFDQGFGDLFVIRVAGNVITDDVIGSIEYARLHLKTMLVVILGHEGCGAVTAALEARNHASSDPHGIQTVLKLIDPAIRDVDSGLPMAEQVHRGVESNVRWSEDELKKLPETQSMLTNVAGAVYNLETGTVRWLNQVG